VKTIRGGGAVVVKPEVVVPDRDDDDDEAPSSPPAVKAKTVAVKKKTGTGTKTENVAETADEKKKDVKGKVCTRQRHVSNATE
jgi:hypothetical protein